MKQGGGARAVPEGRVMYAVDALFQASGQQSHGGAAAGKTSSPADAAALLSSARKASQAARSEHAPAVVERSTSQRFVDVTPQELDMSSVEEQVENLVQRAKSFGSGHMAWQSFRDDKGRDAITAALEEDSDEDTAHDILMQRLAQKVGKRQQQAQQPHSKPATSSLPPLEPLPSLGDIQRGPTTGNQRKAPARTESMRRPAVDGSHTGQAMRVLARNSSLHFLSANATTFALEVAGMADGDFGSGGAASPSSRNLQRTPSILDGGPHSKSRNTSFRVLSRSVSSVPDALAPEPWGTSPVGSSAASPSCTSPGSQVPLHGRRSRNVLTLPEPPAGASSPVAAQGVGVGQAGVASFGRRSTQLSSG